MLSNLRKSRKFLVVALLIMVTVGIYCLQSSKRFKHPSPSISILTVAKIPFDSPHTGIKGLAGTQYAFQPGLSLMEGLLPVTIGEKGKTHIVNGRDILSFNSDGRLLRNGKLRWLNSSKSWLVFLAQENDNILWVCDASSTERPRLTKIENSSSGWMIKSPKTMEIDLPSLFQVAGLYVSKEGDVFLLDIDGNIAQFDGQGNFKQRYSKLALLREGMPSLHPELVGQAFSAFVSQEGIVFSVPFGEKDKNGRLINIRIDKWQDTQHHVSQNIDLTSLGRVLNNDILLVGANRSKDLYFQYIYSPDGLKKSNDIGEFWHGPMGVAKVNDRGEIEKVFDIYENYKAEIKSEIIKANPTRKIRGKIGVGKVVEISSDGDIYIEVATAKDYRIDKISFHRPRQ